MNSSRNDMNSGLEFVNFYMSALAARWGSLLKEHLKKV